MKTIQDMHDELRAKLLKLDPDQRAEALVRICLLWGASGKYSGTADDFTRVMESLRDDFGISADELHDAMDTTELLGEAWQEAGNALTGRN
jgi:hypothetical protein